MYGLYYSINIQFKDGKIRISAPYVDSTILDSGRSEHITSTSFQHYFESPKAIAKYASTVDDIEATMSNLIDRLTTFTKEEETKNDDW